jgi:hypothetical protein
MPSLSTYDVPGCNCIVPFTCACAPPLVDLTVAYNGIANDVFVPTGYTSGSAPLKYRGFAAFNYTWETDCLASGASSFKIKMVRTTGNPNCIDISFTLFPNGTCTPDIHSISCRAPCIEPTGFCASGSSAGIIMSPSTCVPFNIIVHDPSFSCFILEHGGSLVITL